MAKGRARRAARAVRALVLAALAALAGAALAPASPVRAGASGAGAADPPELLRLEQAADYPSWMERFGWENLRPFSDSAQRFRLEDGALRMESRRDSFLIGSRLQAGVAEQRSLGPVTSYS